MRRAPLVASGAALLAGAIGLATATTTDLPAPRTDAAAALGGFRVLAVDALFLRAESLRREGRFDEVRSTYRQILDLEPASVDAVDFLAATEARDLRTSAPTDEGRVRWWRAAMDLVEGGLRANPGSARLHYRAADLLVSVADADPAVAHALAHAGRDREIEGLRHLRQAARLAPEIPRLSALHLRDLARLAPRLAAERYASRGPGVEEALATASELLETRGDVLVRFPLDLDDEISAARRLQAGVNLVKGVRGDLAETPPNRAAAASLLSDYEKVVAKDRVSSALAPLVR